MSACWSAVNYGPSLRFLEVRDLLSCILWRLSLAFMLPVVVVRTIYGFLLSPHHSLLELRNELDRV